MFSNSVLWFWRKLNEAWCARRQYGSPIGLVALAFSLSLKPVLGQTPQLDSLLVLAEASWPQLAERRAQLDAASAAALEAKRGYRPSLSVGGTYTLAAGGRTIGLPLGDLLNGPYAALNQLTQSEQFPQLENTEEPLLPNNFYDARFRVVQPLYQPEIANGRLRAAEGIRAAEAGTEVVAADLRLAVRQAYYQLLSARDGVATYAAAVSLADEAYRTTASLVRNGAALPLARERIVAERAQLRAQLASAEAQQANARANLNYLTGAELAANVSVDAGVGAQAPDALGSELSPGGTAAQLPELEQLGAAVRVSALEAELERQYRRPRVAVQVDAGSQDFDFGLQPYVLAGLSVNVPLYDGGRHGARAQRLAAEGAAAESRLAGTTRALELREQVARNELGAARAALVAYGPALAAAVAAEHDARILYRSGATGYVELLDAQNQLTRTRLQRGIAEYAVWLRYAGLLRAMGQ